MISREFMRIYGCEKIISLLLCISTLFSIVPVKAIATDDSNSVENESSITEIDDFEQTNTIGEIGGYLSGNAITTAK